jgi:hypothetical protein
MRTVISIEGVETKEKDGKPYKITHLTVDTGMECLYYGDDVELGDKVEVFFDDRYNQIKARKTPKPVDT